MINDLITQKLEEEKLIAFDIGAKGGVFLLNKIRNHINYFGFEPNQEEFNKLEKSKDIEYFPVAFGENKGTRDLNITRYSSYSSFLQFDPSNFEKHFGLMKDYEKWKEGMQIDKTISVEVQTFDNFLFDYQIDRIDFLKLDTQGTELEILKGAKNSLKENKIGVIFSEFNFLKIYKNQNSFSELDMYLRQSGYECIDCRFYPNAVQKLNISLNKSRIYDQPRYSIGGDAVFIPQIENSDLDQKSIFRTGLVVAQLGYFSVASSLFKKCNLNEKQIHSLLKYFQTFSIKKWGIEFMPPIIYKIVKAIMKK